MSNLRQIVIFLGAPGSGKGTLSRVCVERLGWKQLSTGDLLRQHVEAQTEVGKEIDFVIKSGMLVQDNLIIDIVVQWLLTEVGGAQVVILDGFPRTLAQAKSFINVISKSFQGVAVNIYRLVVPDAQIVDRLSSRIVCSNKECQAIYSTRRLGESQWQVMPCHICGAVLTKREDDASEKIQARLVSYYRHVDQLLEYYRSIGCEVIDIDATGSSEQVFQTLMETQSVMHSFEQQGAL